jgi:hypothetical protein
MELSIGSMTASFINLFAPISIIALEVQHFSFSFSRRLVP